MCSSCKMDPAWEKVYRLRQGEIPLSDFDEEPRYRKPGKGYGYGRNRKRPRTQRGCPANDNKSHVWVWTTEREPTDLFFKHFGFHKKESKVCCGCGKVDKTRETETYLRRKERVYRKMNGSEFDVPRGEPVSRFGRRWKDRFWSFRWEDLDPEYKTKLDAEYERQRDAWLRSERIWSQIPRRY